MKTQRKQFLEIFYSLDFQKIKDHPNILIAAAFWEEDRYQAARVCYRCLRVIDDMVDDRKAENRPFSEAEKQQFMQSIRQWLHWLSEASTSGSKENELSIFPGQGFPETSGWMEQVASTFREFLIPLRTMEAFARSMMYDIDHDGFATFGDFLGYARGASVAPATVFVHLAGLTRENQQYHLPPFDAEEAATPCAIFSYLVHIIRDFQKDQHNYLTYFPDEMILRYGVSRDDLRRFAFGDPVSPGFRLFIGDLYEQAGIYKERTLEVMERIGPLLEPRYRLSLEIIFNLYLLVYEKIDPQQGEFSSEALNPTPEETRERVLRTIQTFS